MSFAFPYIWNIRFVLEVAEEFHKICPKVPIWVGGPEVSYEVEDFLKKNRFITGVMVGEGEKIFRHVCDCYVNQDGHGLENIKGLAFLDADGHMVCKEPEMPMDLSEIPFCYDYLLRIQPGMSVSMQLLSLFD